MAKYRSALGKIVDMSILAAKNEKTRAVGNMNVNARGDTIDAQGNVISTATSKVNEAYSKTVGNRSAQPVRKQVRQGDDQPRKVQPSRAVNQQVKEVEELTKSELELDEDLDNDIEVEKIKAREKNAK